jgi:hypothetical protein
MKVHRRAPLYSAFQLPIIVAMKICFRIGAEQDGSQQPKRYRSARVKAQLRPRRFSGARLLAAQPVSRQTTPTTKDSLKTERIFRSGHATSDWYWPKNRSYRKQAIKPCLTGTRIACEDFDFLHFSTAVLP